MDADAPMATKAIKAVQQSGANIALLHGLDQLHSSGNGNDTDVVIDRPPLEALRQARPALYAIGLTPIIVHFYDNSSSAAIILTNATATRGVHLDMMYDPLGRGPYGIRSDSLLHWAEHRDPVPMIKEEASIVYLWRKRLVKGQLQRLAALSQRMAEIGPERMRWATASLLGDAKHAEAMLSPPTTRHHQARSFPSVRRIATRLQSPAGYWTHCTDAEPAMVVQLSQRFSAFIPRVTAPVLPAAPATALGPWCRVVAPTRWRAGLAISAGPTIRWLLIPSPDLVLGPSTTTDEAARDIVAAMTSRFYQ